MKYLLQSIKQIIKELNLNVDNVYNDGTKLEANANKYKFMWKPKKYHQNLDIKIKNFILSINYEIKFDNDKLIKSIEFNKILSDYINKENINIYDIPCGPGCRRTLAQKNLLGFQYLTKLLKYGKKEEICGKNRNSYYKTDRDATAMVLKEDYYSKLSHDFHAGYGIDVNYEYIKKHNIGNYVKYQNWEGESTGKHP